MQTKTKLALRWLSFGLAGTLATLLLVAIVMSQGGILLLILLATFIILRSLRQAWRAMVVLMLCGSLAVAGEPYHLISTEDPPASPKFTLLEAGVAVVVIGTMAVGVGIAWWRVWTRQDLTNSNQLPPDKVPTPPPHSRFPTNAPPIDEWEESDDTNATKCATLKLPKEGFTDYALTNGWIGINAVTLEAAPSPKGPFTNYMWICQTWDNDQVVTMSWDTTGRRRTNVARFPSPVCRALPAPDGYYRLRQGL